MSRIMKIVGCSIPFLFLGAVTGSAQLPPTRYATRCAQTPVIMSALKDSIATSVLDQVDRTQYELVRVHVGLRILARDTTEVPVEPAQLAGGLAIQRNGFPDGLAFGLGGTVNYTQPNLCVYTVRVIISTTGRRIGTPDRLATRSESNITLTTPFLAPIKKTTK